MLKLFFVGQFLYQVHGPKDLSDLIRAVVMSGNETDMNHPARSLQSNQSVLGFSSVIGNQLMT